MTNRRALIVGAGMPGLSTAWFLQQFGYDVVVVDSKGVAGGASWGNAGWVSPALTLPLNHPGVLRTGTRAALKPSSPVYVPPTLSPKLLSFLVRFAAQCTSRRWTEALDLYISANRLAVGAFEALMEGGVDQPLHRADPLLAAFTSLKDRAHLIHELEMVRERGGDAQVEELSEEHIRGLEPSLSAGVTCGLALTDQRFIDPGRFTNALADQVRARGGSIQEGEEMVILSQARPHGVTANLVSGLTIQADVAVLATGAALSRHARELGVRTQVQAGRGYSFTVYPDVTPRNPIYFPSQRVACTPVQGGLRVAGMMEFKAPSAPLDPRRIKAIVAATRPLLSGVDWAARTDEWVGSRPCTPDGLPLVGRTTAPDVYVIGGHGMWGVALGPLTGQLLATQIATGQQPDLLAGFNPLR